MSIGRSLLMHMFGRPRGVLGRVGGHLMARMNAECGAWVADRLKIGPKDRVLEVGFGPGVIINRLANLAPGGHIAGVDPSREMVEQARARNVTAIESGRVDLRQGSVESLPFDDDSFDKAIAINSMQVWPDAVAGLRDIRRVLKPGARIALGFTSHSGQSNEGLAEIFATDGFDQAQVVQTRDVFCVLATRP